MKNLNFRTLLALPMAAALALSLSACEESGDSKAANKGASKKSAPVSEADCPILPIDSTATGEFDPIASKDARACGSITLWGSAMPKSFNMWEDYNSFSAELMGMMFEPLEIGRASCRERV